MYCFRQYFTRGFPFTWPKRHSRGIKLSQRYYGRSPRCKGRLTLRPMGTGMTLWRYFNAPGNVMFVTTNVVTLLGIMSYTTIQNMAREQAMQEYLEHKSFGDDTVDIELTQGSPRKRYRKENIKLSKNQPPSNCYAQHAKMSLFHLLYSFYICRDVASENEVRGSSEWKEELDDLQDEVPERHSSHISTRMFYHLWRSEFGQIFDNLSRSQQFHMPNWKHYPGSLQVVCQSLYDSELRTVADFIKFYKGVKQGTLKELLRAWFYDNMQLFQSTSDNDNEYFYRYLVQACENDEPLFNQYASIMLNPSNPRRRAFFNRRNQYSSASLETFVEVLKGNLRAAAGAVEKSYYHESILNLVSMLRTSCFLAQNSNGSHEVRILLPGNMNVCDSLPYPHTSSADRFACYKLVSENAEVMAVLGAISKLPS
ncbi:Pet494p [Lachancea thermotolerans CBS 6340]|uniref:KLTH0A07414p n=1 Tax=Lachancea thermotolerans (strain ATCC 56472 / CBS 6340 / NRRL Y-8284) TaxID=559295 RepID=C5DC32_LACTC|nr:KLTH0A07414p [Lachancea thermotolerans CBS 6340]CAR21339.1 KLTH0A07414p [Lachancea thermotolerans CBS 6340]